MALAGPLPRPCAPRCRTQSKVTSSATQHACDKSNRCFDSEAWDIEKAAGRAAVLDLYFPGEDQPRRVAMDATAFDSAATDAPMEQILAFARPPRRAPRSRAATERAAAGPAATEPAGTEPGAAGRAGPSEKCPRLDQQSIRVGT